MPNPMIKRSIAFLMMPLILAGCTWGSKPTSQAIDPPPTQAKLDAEPVAAKQAEQKQGRGTELYFLTDAGYVIPYTVDVPASKQIAKEAMRFMVKGEPGAHLLPAGIEPILPQRTKIKGLNIQDGTATIDFSKEFLNYPADMEEKVLSAVTWALTGFPKVKEVNIWVEGKPLAEMPKKKTPALHLTRNRGINLEMEEGVDIGQSMPVTLYFLGQTPDNHVYYVPVTRMINREANVAQATLKELIKGPKQQSGLSSAIDQTLEVNKVDIAKNMVVADLGEQILQFSAEHRASKDAIGAIVLSLTENTGLKKVKLTVNGKQNVTVAGEKGSLTKPVDRPEKVNPQSL
ncbi:GerMN domain-containing protein [Laceyella putida]|uniref:GerMN domain-containing protein n=1 Tax=Laceyella putida TaxID=110101 RepID=A0ABW2RIL1_9BACL